MPGHFGPSFFVRQTLNLILRPAFFCKPHLLPSRVLAPVNSEVKMGLNYPPPLLPLGSGWTVDYEQS